MFAITFEYGNPVYVFIPTILHEDASDEEFSGFCVSIAWLSFSLTFHYGREIS